MDTEQNVSVAIERILADLVVFKIFFIPIETNDNSMQYHIVRHRCDLNKTKIQEDVNWVKEGF